MFLAELPTSIGEDRFDSIGRPGPEGSVAREPAEADGKESKDGGPVLRKATVAHRANCVSACRSIAAAPIAVSDQSKPLADDSDTGADVPAGGCRSRAATSVPCAGRCCPT